MYISGEHLNKRSRSDQKSEHESVDCEGDISSRVEEPVDRSEHEDGDDKAQNKADYRRDNVDSADGYSVVDNPEQVDDEISGCDIKERFFEDVLVVNVGNSRSRSADGDMRKTGEDVCGNLEYSEEDRVLRLEKRCLFVRILLEILDGNEHQDRAEDARNADEDKASVA